MPVKKDAMDASKPPDGIIAVGNAHQKHVKLTLASGAHLADPNKVFNDGLEGNKWRSIDLFEGDTVNAAGLKKLVPSAIDFNWSKTKEKARAKQSRAQLPKSAKT